MKHSEVNISVFYCYTSLGKRVYLNVYLVIIGNDATKIIQLKQHLWKHFQTQDPDSLEHFLGIEVSQSKKCIVISRRKCVGYLERNKNEWL